MMICVRDRNLKAAHSGRLERWLGREAVDGLVRAVHGRRWYGPPIAVAGVPGNVRITKDGDFIGPVDAGSEASAMDRASEFLRVHRNEKAAIRAERMLDSNHFARERMTRRVHAFASMSAVVAARTGGKGADMWFNKVGVASNAIGNCVDLWRSGVLPAAGAAGSAAPGGKAWTNADVGSLNFPNAVTNANTSHFVSGWATASVINNTLLLYDRLLSVVKTMNSTATEAVTGTFARYQSQTVTNADFIGGTFIFPSCPTTILPATAHNWTVVQYTDQGGNATQSAASIAGVSACVVQGVDLAAGNWFIPLAAGDFGAKALTQMQCSALVATGTIDFNVGHPIAFLACPIANLFCNADGINTAFNFVTVFDNAALALLEMPKSATTATTYSGQATTVSE